MINELKELQVNSRSELKFMFEKILSNHDVDIFKEGSTPLGKEIFTIFKQKARVIKQQEIIKLKDHINDIKEYTESTNKEIAIKCGVNENIIKYIIYNKSANYVSDEVIGKIKEALL